FLLSVAEGGGLGGLAVSLVAPHVFTTFFEWNLALALGYLLAAALLVRGIWEWVRRQELATGSGARPWGRTIVGVAGALLAAVGLYDLYGFLQQSSNHVQLRERNF